jgi:hypothetical protein
MPPNTKRKTKNNRKTRKIKGGFWCTFENKIEPKCHHVNPVYDSGFYYYYLNEDTSGEKTLFAYKPHVFKHFDEFYPYTKPDQDIVSVKNKFFPKENVYRDTYNISFHVDKSKRPGNLQVFIDLFNEFIEKNDLSYAKLLATIVKKTRDSTKYNVSVIRDSLGRTEIWWQKKQKPSTLPKQINNIIDQKTYNFEINYCIQIIHIHDYDKNPRKNIRSYEYRTPTPVVSAKTPTPVVSPQTPTQVNTANPRTSFDFNIENNKNQKFINTKSINDALKEEKKKFLEDIKKIKSSSK